MRSLRFNKKAKRSHRTEKEEFYQLLDDVGPNQKLADWKRFSNFDRPLGVKCTTRRAIAVVHQAILDVSSDETPDFR
jgi:hypothetical protein